MEGLSPRVRGNLGGGRTASQGVGLNSWRRLAIAIALPAKGALGSERTRQRIRRRPLEALLRG